MIASIIILSIFTALGVTGMALAVGAVIDARKFYRIGEKKETITTLQRFDMRDWEKRK